MKNTVIGQCCVIVSRDNIDISPMVHFCKSVNASGEIKFEACDWAEEDGKVRSLLKISDVNATLQIGNYFITKESFTIGKHSTLPLFSFWGQIP